MKKQAIPRPDGMIALPKQARGRPTRLTDEVASKILMAVKSGSHRSVAATWAGVELDVFFRWLGMSGEPYETFKRLLEESEAHSELKAVASVTKAADADARVAVAFLERRFPVRWARAAPSTSVNIDLGSMLEKIHARIAAYKDPREARRALSSGSDVQVLDADGHPVLPRDPRPPRPTRQPVRPVRQPVTPPARCTTERDETDVYDGEHEADRID